MTSLAIATPSQKRSLAGRLTTLATEERLNWNQSCPGTDARGSQRRHNGKRNKDNTSPPKDLAERNCVPPTGACRTHVRRGGIQREEPTTARSNLSLDSAKLGCFLSEIRARSEPTRKTGRDRRRNRRRNANLDRGRVLEEEPCKLSGAVAPCMERQIPRIQPTR